SSCVLASTPKFCDVTPDVTGTWALLLDPGDSSVGSATFSYAADQEVGPLTSGLPVTTLIATSGQDASYTFAAVAGGHVSFAVTAAGWGSGSAELEVFRPDGTLY